MCSAAALEKDVVVAQLQAQAAAIAQEREALTAQRINTDVLANLSEQVGMQSAGIDSCMYVLTSHRDCVRMYIRVSVCACMCVSMYIPVRMYACVSLQPHSHRLQTAPVVESHWQQNYNPHQPCSMLL